METLVPHPEFKMLGLRNIPQMPENCLAYSTFSWPGLLKHLRQMLIANAKMEEGKKRSLNHHSLRIHLYIEIKLTALWGSLISVAPFRSKLLPSDSRNLSPHSQLLLHYSFSCHSWLAHVFAPRHLS